MLQVSSGKCPNCNDDMWVTCKMLKKQNRTILVIACGKCDFFWPSHVDVYYDGISDAERNMSSREIVDSRLEFIRFQVQGLFALHSRLKSIKIVSERFARFKGSGYEVITDIKIAFRVTKAQLRKLAKTIKE